LPYTTLFRSFTVFYLYIVFFICRKNSLILIVLKFLLVQEEDHAGTFLYVYNKSGLHSREHLGIIAVLTFSRTAVVGNLYMDLSVTVALLSMFFKPLLESQAVIGRHSVISKKCYAVIIIDLRHHIFDKDDYKNQDKCSDQHMKFVIVEKVLDFFLFFFLK